MNDTISRIGAEFATLQSGLEGLLARLQTLNHRVVEANRALDDTATTLDTLAPSAPDAGPATVEVPAILDVGEDTPPAIVTEEGANERTKEEQGEGLPTPQNGATVPHSANNGKAKKTPTLPQTWEDVRRLKGATLERTLEELGLPRARGAGSAMQNHARIWDRINNHPVHD